MAVVQERGVSISCYPYNVIWELFSDNKVVLTARQVYESVEPMLVTEFWLEKMEGCLERMAEENFLTRVDDSGTTQSYRLFQGGQSSVLGFDQGDEQPSQYRRSTTAQNRWNSHGFKRKRK